MMSAEVFALLGMIIDTTVSDDPVFFTSWENGVLFVECYDTDIIARMILPLCYKKVYQFLENCNWFVAIIKISQQPQYQIAEIVFENDLGESCVCQIGDNLLDKLQDRGMDDTYFKFCQEITEKIM